VRVEAKLLLQRGRRTGGTGLVPSGIAVLDLDHFPKITRDGPLASFESGQVVRHPTARRDTMITLRKASDRFHTNIDWLDSWHTFSFGEHYDPRQSGFSALRVINDDTVLPGQGFGSHPHRDMEILSYVLTGALAHRDSSGGGGVIRPGDVQRMSAGSGVVHSEFNASHDEPVHFLQIWLLPDQRGIAPGYEQKTFPEKDRRGQLRLLASRDGRQGSVTIHQDAAVYGALLAKGERASFELGSGRSAWVHVARGSVELNGARLSAGDGAALKDEKAVGLVGLDAAEVLLFDLP
jgi:hypothetical protein